jgi:predicted AAA+ superfamily ATPase
MKIGIDSHQASGRLELSGSQRHALMDKASESLAGRIAILELQGYSLRELAGKGFYQPFLPSSGYYQERQAFERGHDSQAKGSVTSAGARLWQHIHRGSMPRLHGTSVDWETYCSAYVQASIERDVRQLAQIGDEMAFRRYLVAMAARTGELVNYSNVSRDVGVSVDTVRRWTSVLRASGIIEMVAPYTNSALARAIRTPKAFFMDTGLACYLTGWMTPEALERGAKAGSMFETFVVSEIIKSWLNSGKGAQRLSFYRDKQGNEIDLIIEEDGVLHPVEIKMTATPNKSMAIAFGRLDGIHGAERGMGAVICQRPDPLYLDKDVLSLPVSYL